MTALQLKKRLNKKINESDDIALLKAIETFFEKKSNEEAPFPLTKAQQESIRIGEEQIKKGQYKTSRQVIKDARKWLKGK